MAGRADVADRQQASRTATAAQTSSDRDGDVERRPSGAGTPGPAATPPTAAARATAVHAPPTSTSAMTKASSLADQEKLCLRNSKCRREATRPATQAERTATSSTGRLTGSGASGSRASSAVGTASSSPSAATVQGLRRRAAAFGARTSCSATRTCIPGEDGRAEANSGRRPDTSRLRRRPKGHVRPRRNGNSRAGSAVGCPGARVSVGRGSRRISSSGSTLLRGSTCALHGLPLRNRAACCCS